MKMKLLSGLLATLLVPSVASATNIPQKLVTPKDPAIVNYEQIAYWLIKRGELKASASEAEKDAAINHYLKGLGKHTTIQPRIVQKTLQNQQVAYKSGHNLAQKDGSTKTVKVLSVLIDFPDLKHDSNGLSQGDTGMYYSSYPASHYQNLMFSETGFVGPSGQNLTSGYQYYQNESGGSFNFTGKVYGWVTADKNAAFYGTNDADTTNDQNVPALIKEAVSKAVSANNIDLSEYDVEDPYDLNGNGNVNEADGMIDHVMVFHSSIGEEAGGGNLGDEAVWSHRFYVDTDTNGYTIPGTSKKLFGYTVQPIDAATGVVVHEFGHDLGVPDEYDTGDSNSGSPVGLWSVMASGSWGGKIPGTQPTGFSPYARAYFQSVYGGNWINEKVINFESEATGSQSIELVEAINHNSINQLRIDMPKPEVAFEEPYSGQYQYYSGTGHYMDNDLSFEADIPASGSTTMSMKARWDIEVDYDYAQVLVNGTAIAGNYTKASNQYHNGVTNFISGKSAGIAGAEGALGWVDLNFDLSKYAGQSVNITIQYVTDPAVGGYGLVIDDLAISNEASEFYADGAEQGDKVNLNGFLRVTNKKPGKPQNYWVQLRSQNGQDDGLAQSVYTPGVVVWFSNSAYSDNKVGEHPGHGFIGVVDADQNPVKHDGAIASSELQVIDAAFSLYAQKSYAGDSNLQPTALFSDNLDYSFSEQPESGLVLPQNGLTIEVTKQTSDNSSATVKVTKGSIALLAGFDYEVNYKKVSFSNMTSGGDHDYSYAWDFGDNSAISVEEEPVHTFMEAGNYTVKLTVTDGEATVDSAVKSVSIAEVLQATINSSVEGAGVTVSAGVTGGASGYTYSWDFGDGVSAEGVDGEHTYSLTGTYTVTLTVSSGDNQEVKITKDVSVVAPMNAGFTASTNGLKAMFSANANGGDGSYTYAWDFGDDVTSTSVSPSHIYSSEGSYSVELTITDGTGVEEQIVKTVKVKEVSSGGGGGGSSSLLLLMLLGVSVLIRRKR